jgi:hypothetical protein
MTGKKNTRRTRWEDARPGFGGSLIQGSDYPAVAQRMQEKSTCRFSQMKEQKHESALR